MSVIDAHFSQHGLMKGLLDQSDLSDQMTCLVDSGKAVVIVYLDISKAADGVSHNVLLQKLAARGLDMYTLCWVMNWLVGRALRMVVNGVKSKW